MALSYLASLDSVRFERPSQPERLEFAANQYHAEIEILLSLLFGQQIVVSENQSFDSAGFLNIATQILNKRQHDARHKPFGNPFKVALRRGEDKAGNENHSDYKRMAAALLRRQKGFILSANPEINDEERARELFAKAMDTDSPDFREVAQIIGPEKTEQYKMLATYFDDADYPQAADTKLADVPLTGFTEWLVGLSDDELESMIPGDPSRAIELRNAASQLEKAGIRYSDRSAVRSYGPSQLEPEVFNGILVYVDESYNKVIASSVNADDRVFSNVSSGEYAQVAAKLAANRPPNREQFEDSDAPISVEIDPTLLSRYGKPIPWDEVWRILTDGEWERSVINLQQNYIPGSGEEPFWKHLELVAKMLDEQVGSLVPDSNLKLVKLLRKAPAPISIAGTGVLANLIVTYTLGIPFAGDVVAGLAMTPLVSLARTRIRQGSLRRAILRSVYRG